jgi:hypothetical protein
MNGETTMTMTITEREIEALLYDAAEHGDFEQVEICDRALAGNPLAWDECARILADARARED